MSESSRSKIPSSEEHRRSALKEYKRQWHIKNRAKIVAKASKWNKENHKRRLEIQAISRYKNRDKIRAQNKIYRAEYRRKVMDHYSDGSNSCSCCGETMFQFLTIDHIDGGGNEHRKITKTKGGHHFYYWLIRNDYPKGFQVLCFNCNMSKAHFGKCPHDPVDL